MRDEVAFYHMVRCVGVSKRHYKEMMKSIHSGYEVFVGAKKIDAYLDGCERYLKIRPIAKLAESSPHMEGPRGPHIYSLTLHTIGK